MNDLLPKLTPAGFNMLSHLSTGARRIGIFPYRERKYTIDGDVAVRTTVERLVRDGYLEPTPRDRPMFYDRTAQAKLLICPLCRGQGIVECLTAPGEVDTCTKCSGRRIIAPGTDHTPPFAPAVRKPASRRFVPKVVDPSPTKPGLYWLALDDASSFVKGSPFLVRVTDEMAECDFGEHTSEFRIVRIVFADPDRTFSEVHAETLEEIREGAIRRFSWEVGIGGFVTGSTSEEFRLNWMGRVMEPKLPEEIKPVTEPVSIA